MHQMLPHKAEHTVKRRHPHAYPLTEHSLTGKRKITHEKAQVKQQ